MHDRYLDTDGQFRENAQEEDGDCSVVLWRSCDAGRKRSVTDECAEFHRMKRNGEALSTNMEVDATWLDTGTDPDTVRDTQIAQEPISCKDSEPRQVRQHGAANEIQDEREEMLRELFCPHNVKKLK